MSSTPFYPADSVLITRFDPFCYLISRYLSLPSYLALICFLRPLFGFSSTDSRILFCTFAFSDCHCIYKLFSVTATILWIIPTVYGSLLSTPLIVHLITNWMIFGNAAYWKPNSARFTCFKLNKTLHRNYCLPYEKANGCTNIRSNNSNKTLIIWYQSSIFPLFFYKLI